MADISGGHGIYITSTQQHNYTKVNNNMTRTPTHQLKHSPLILSMYICTMLQQELHNRHTVVSGGEVEWSGMAAIQVPHIDEMRLGGEDASDTVNVPRLGCLK